MKYGNSKIWGWTLVAFGVGLLLTVLYLNSVKRQVPVIFTPREMLVSLWEGYKREYIDEDGRTIDKQRENVTTSEGQSYSMLRAVWLDDREAFDKSWEWTQNNLARPQDNLFAWLFGKKPNGTYGVLTDEGGQNTASDADTDIALALVFAYSRWQDDKYLEAAQKIIQDIWTHEVVLIRGRPYLVANNVEKTKPGRLIVVNPSYFAPYAYRIFDEVDPNHNWLALADTSYEVIEKSSGAGLDKTQSAGIPPDWILLDRQTGNLMASDNKDLSTNYSFDAMRIPWRLAMDLRWFGEPRAKKLLESFEFFNEEWKERGALYASYSHAGDKMADFEAPSVYGGSLGHFLATDNESARQIYEWKLRSLFNSDTNAWKYPLSYYDDNWAWFGMALYHDTLPNIFATLSDKNWSSREVVNQ
jgi:endo-1,4-beta-D-glucanase Y